MQKVFVMYNLKPGVALEDYMAWSRTRDQVVTPFQSGVIRFEVYAVQGAEKGAPPYQIIEDIEVESWAAWQQALAGTGMAPIVSEWDAYGDASSLVMVYADKVK
ncbi:MAG: hypothetical protein EPO26_13300 [Chloroflexota bacterium]|nr:MAG: hypothetical protein EPO26_13300 [Chloroflexota bacterium]